MRIYIEKHRLLNIFPKLKTIIMKLKNYVRFCITLTVILGCFNAKAQQNWDTTGWKSNSNYSSGDTLPPNWDNLPWKSYSDYRLQNLNKAYVTTNILYDQMFLPKSITNSKTNRL